MAHNYMTQMSHNIMWRDGMKLQTLITTLAAALALSCTTLNAQVTFSNFTPSPGEDTAFVCDASGHYMPTTLSSCRGIYYIDPVTGVTQLEELWTPSWYQIGGYAPIAQPVDVFNSHIIEFTDFTDPQGCTLYSRSAVPCATPGTFTFTWNITDANGVVHTGTHSGTWDARNFCGGKACWVHPVLLTNTLTINN
jgi:hypothetical protein